MNTTRTTMRPEDADQAVTPVHPRRPLLTEEYVAEQAATSTPVTRVTESTTSSTTGTAATRTAIEVPESLQAKPGRSKTSRLVRTAALGLAASAVVVLGSLAGGEAVASLLTPDSPAATSGPVTGATPKTKATGLAAMPVKAEPTTVRGYERMFDAVSQNEWGGADVSVSGRLPDGRIVWLYGDTLSFDNGFVNSTAIVQDGGNLHVSRGGAQVLPGEPKVDGRKRIYWIETMKVIGKNRVSITAMPMSIGSESVWDFERWNPLSRVATLRVTAAGDVVFEKWTGWTTAPVLPDEFIVLGPNHFTYQPVIHEHIRLANGQYLKTVSQNWDDAFEDHVGADGKMNFKDWRPIFSQVSAPTDPDAL